MTLPLPSFPTSPNTCGLQSLLSAGLAFSNVLPQAASALKSSLLSTVSLIQNLPNIISGMVMADVAALISRVEAIANGVVNSLISHLTSMISNLVTNLGLVVGQLAAQAGLVGGGCNIASQGGNPPPSDPCDIMGKVFGSLTGAASGLISQATGALNSVTGAIAQATSGALTAINDITAAIGSGIAAIEGVAANITNMISNEVAGLAAALSDLLAFSAASALPGLYNHQCAKAVLSAVGTPALLTHFV